MDEKIYTERELEIAFCIGLLNRMLTMDELQRQLQTSKDIIKSLKESIKRGDFEVELSKEEPKP